MNNCQMHLYFHDARPVACEGNGTVWIQVENEERGWQVVLFLNDIARVRELAAQLAAIADELEGAASLRAQGRATASHAD